MQKGDKVRVISSYEFDEQSKAYPTYANAVVVDVQPDRVTALIDHPGNARHQQVVAVKPDGIYEREKPAVKK